MICASIILVRPRTPTVADPLSGVWIGDWGPTPSHRNLVTVRMRWDGVTLKGIVNPGPNATEFTKASFDPQTATVHFEVEVVSAGREVHYVIDGTIEGRTLIGNWYNDDNRGNFRLLKK